ncbi:hypothetical protein C7M84_006665 [Penaeus vannamei]|uniref:Uncharacterized protein n=1 Tax=Penaeus vannamei TaxID=6689 RepID=A0A423TEA4_PENVA|nr:hypothetical protein C7M84_006665 [Penaeus vannamei]
MEGQAVRRDKKDNTEPHSVPAWTSLPPSRVTCHISSLFSHPQKRTMYKMWAQVVATRSRRCVACVVLACILLTVQVITHQVRQEAVVDESMNPQQLTTMLKQDEEGFKLPIIPAKGFDLRAAQVGKAKGDILKNLSELDIKQLQKVQQFVNSAHDPQAVEEFRIDQALQSLKSTPHLQPHVSSPGAAPRGDQNSARSSRRSTGAPTRGQAISTGPARPTPREGDCDIDDVALRLDFPGGAAVRPTAAVYNHYEPLMQFGLKQIREGQDSVKAQNLAPRPSCTGSTPYTHTDPPPLLFLSPFSPRAPTHAHRKQTLTITTAIPSSTTPSGRFSVPPSRVTSSPHRFLPSSSLT